MSFSGGRTPSWSSSVLYSYLVVTLMIISVQQIWVVSENRVGAIRIFPEEGRVALQRQNHHHHRLMKSNVSQTEIFRKYFHTRVSDLNSSSSASPLQTGTNSFQESKRRVPSCPDQLHNK
ncbi:OLC1v1032290C1 [Oldenlandia corymbosa var. corymbosa]|uniref:OLC1v1032290C1 n=1 Tax=Oldenlandia corymbosa var. corymbosa TaxID=529605 RepID=A0AAV1CNC4_OLDCO|nr:OLC1v1032290C1 [Oldenlandia corymbosa var. corymbosa]